MWFIVIAGIYWWFHLVREFFPNAESEMVFITVPYPGATPEEVEKSVTRRIEREIENVDEVDEIISRVLEGVTVIQVSLEEGADRQRVLNDLRSEIDKVKPDLPDGAEDPEIKEMRPTLPVVGVVIFGDVSETDLREAAKDLEDDLLDLPGITEVVLSGVRAPEIWAEVRPEMLEEHGITFEEVGRAMRGANLDLPGGQLKSDQGNIRVRTIGEQNRAREIESLVVTSRADGTAVRLRDLAWVRETFEDRVERGRYAGKPAALVTVFKTPEQDAIQISTAVKKFVADHPDRLGGALSLEVTTDLARFIEQRLDLMKRNARLGIILVLIALAFFLDLRVAFWVGMGLAIAFLGTFVLMHAMDASINLISLFGLIVVLGLIVDDAIVIGENFYTKLGEGLSPHDAAIEGTNEVAMPVLAAVLTTIAAFLPLMFLGGMVGTFLGVLPVVVIAALGVSLVEAFIILPSHLGHQRIRDPNRPRRFPGLNALGQRLRTRQRRFIEGQLADLYERCLRFVLRWRYPSIAAAFAISAAAAGLVVSGIVPFVLLQDTDAETVSITLEMAAGTPEKGTLDVISRIERMALSSPETRTVFATIGSAFDDRGRVTPADPATVGQLVIELVPAEERENTGQRNSKRLVADWRAQTAQIPGVARLNIRSRGGGPRGTDIEIRVRADDLDLAHRAAGYIQELLADYEGVSEIEDDLTEGKLEVRLRLLDTARSLGLTTSDLAVQVRHALFGFEVQDLQGEDEEITVRAVLPEAARREIGDLGRFRLKTSSGARVPLSEVADLTTERGYSSLVRVDGKRAVSVTAEVDDDVANSEKITSELAEKLTGIGRRFPGVTVSFEGQKKETMESIGSLKLLFPVALLIIYALLATLFRSYTQPVVVMAAIPYAFVGAILGHLVMGYPFTILSMIGGVALAGIVVNDSLILVDFINRRRREGIPLLEAVVQGGRARLRPILLTSITTIFGIGPLMLEKSFQAQFLIPMAVSIVFGLALATLLTLVLLPTIYLVFEDIRGVFRFIFTGHFHAREGDQ
jgi:hydrophobic/amphiphilic exporter-1 (mainly G- bacteria), HAE1 family